MANALADLKLQAEPNYLTTANKHGVSRPSLRARFLGIHTSRAEAASTYHRQLTDTQEKVLIGHISRLTNCGMPSTTSMVSSGSDSISSLTS